MHTIILQDGQILTEAVLSDDSRHWIVGTSVYDSDQVAAAVPFHLVAVSDEDGTSSMDSHVAARDY